MMKVILTAEVKGKGHEGDVVDVGAGGRATLVMGGSFVRMAPGSELRLDRLDPSHPVVNQLSGRAYHRVSVGPNGNYTVITDTVTWVATGTAFDLDRHPVGAGGEEVTGLALLDGLNLQGPQVKAALNQGQGAVVQLASAGSSARAPAIDQISAKILADPWLVQNAHLDALAGLDLGELAVDVGPVASLVPSPTVAPTAAPTADPFRQPTLGPTRRPTPRPTPAGPPNLGNLTISDNGNGTFTFNWPKYTGDGFTFYKLVYADWGRTPSYPASPYWACNSGVDQNSWTGSIDIGDYAVRVQVVDESKGSVIRAQTKVVRLKVTGPTPTPGPTPPPTQSLGSLSVQDDGGGYFTFSWAPYTGGWPFDAYKLVYMTWPGSPSYLSHYDGFWAFGTGQTSSGSILVPSGHWAFRVQAIGTPGGKGYDFARTGVFEVTVP
jgi:FecR protein./Ribosomal protein L9, N-terminal domain.